MPEGPSDKALARLVEALFRRAGVAVRLAALDLNTAPGITGHSVLQRMTGAMDLSERTPDVVVVHRDCDAQSFDQRSQEISEASLLLDLGMPVVKVLPRRSTETWLLTDEAEIRRVAGNPRSRVPLKLPRLRNLESHAHPKGLLQDVLIQASETTGRRRAQAQRRFDRQREQLIERLTVTSRAAELESWKLMAESVHEAASRLT